MSQEPDQPANAAPGPGPQPAPLSPADPFQPGDWFPTMSQQPAPAPVAPVEAAWGAWWPPPLLPRLWTVFVAFIIVLAGHFGLSVCATIYMMLSSHSTAPPSTEGILRWLAQPRIFLPFMFAAVTITLLGGVLPALMSPVYLRDRLRVAAPRARWWRVLLMVIGSVACSWTVWALVEILRIPQGGALGFLSDAIGRLDSWRIVLGVLIIGEIGPIAEEILFRGYIQTRLSARWKPAWGVVAAAAMFGLLHLDPVQSSFAFLLGLFLGYVTERSSSIWPAAGGHALNNTLSVVLVSRGGELSILGTPWIMLVISAVALALCIIGIEWRSRTPGTGVP